MSKLFLVGGRAVCFHTLKCNTKAKSPPNLKTGLINIIKKREAMLEANQSAPQPPRRHLLTCWEDEAPGALWLSVCLPFVPQCLYCRRYSIYFSKTTVSPLLLCFSLVT